MSFGFYGAPSGGTAPSASTPTPPSNSGQPIGLLLLLTHA